MKQCRFIVNKKENGFYNMALDEAIFDLCKRADPPFSVLRVYSWDNPCLTIGYFQNYKEIKESNIYDCRTDELPVIRRLTGGLAVHHADDISYSFVTNALDWPYVYDQENGYKAIHSGIKEALENVGIKADFVDPVTKGNNNSICVDTTFSYDLHINGKKIVGSCQRRSGKVLLQQGSLHLPKKYGFDEIQGALRQALEKTLGMDIIPSTTTKEEKTLADSLLKNKYKTEKWNQRLTG